MDAATVMPAQLFTWAGMPERMYIEKTAAGIMVLLSVLNFIKCNCNLFKKKIRS